MDTTNLQTHNLPAAIVAAGTQTAEALYKQTFSTLLEVAEEDARFPGEGYALVRGLAAHLDQFPAYVNQSKKPATAELFIDWATPYITTGKTIAHWYSLYRMAILKALWLGLGTVGKELMEYPDPSEEPSTEILGSIVELENRVWEWAAENVADLQREERASVLTRLYSYARDVVARSYKRERLFERDFKDPNEFKVVEEIGYKDRKTHGVAYAYKPESEIEPAPDNTDLLPDEFKEEITDDIGIEDAYGEDPFGQQLQKAITKPRKRSQPSEHNKDKLGQLVVGVNLFCKPCQAMRKVIAVDTDRPMNVGRLYCGHSRTAAA